jgi:hypothetical protein
MLENRAIAMIHCGREISDEEIAQIQETVGLCRGLSRKELAQTIAEHMQWYRASGTNKEDACIKLLEKLELKRCIAASRQASTQQAACCKG